jgi:hypothetical protein
MRMKLVGLACLGLALEAGCGTDAQPAREPLGTGSTAPDGGVPAADAGPPGESPADGGADGQLGSGYPCDVHAVLEAYCARCHTGETYAVEYVTPVQWRETWVSGQTFGQYAVSRMRDPQNSMPPAYDTGPRPSAAEIDVVAAWVDAGMPEGTCGPLTPPR